VRRLSVQVSHVNLRSPFDWACRVAFMKWKASCVRHAEELSLMESYQEVKREGTLALLDVQRRF
jgi:hypothetical protein